MNPIEAWLAARDADSLDRTWRALDARELADVAPPAARVCEQAAARLAAELLGWPVERVAWLANNPYDRSRPSPPPRDLRQDVARCYLENAVDFRAACSETWSVCEDRDGARGVQRVVVGFGLDDGSRDGGGGGGSVARVFDLDAGFAVSVVLCGREVSIVAPDGARAAIEARARRALDLYLSNVPARVEGWTGYDHARLRGLVATLAAAVDGGFAGSETWAGTRTATEAATDYRETRLESLAWRFAEPGGGARALTMSEYYVEGGEARVVASAEVEGLSWGSLLVVSVDLGPADAWSASVSQRLSRAQLDAVAAAFARVDGARLG
ncbi:MAG: hypothetical protein JWM10_1430 [Myxococcaceae bacterium]|nr:hypothetical protein [Myxococcaceae bacterium]